MGRIVPTYKLRSLELLMKSDKVFARTMDEYSFFLRKFAREMRMADYSEIKEMMDEFLKTFFRESYVIRYKDSRNKERIPLLDTLPYNTGGMRD